MITPKLCMTLYGAWKNDFFNVDQKSKMDATTGLAFNKEAYRKLKNSFLLEATQT